MFGIARRFGPSCFLVAALAAAAVPPFGLVGLGLPKAFQDADDAAAVLRAGAPTADQQKRVADRLEQLGDDRFEIREAARRDLLALGSVGLVPLAKGLDSPDPEVQRQVIRLREILKADEVRSRQFAAVEFLERQPKLTPGQVEPLFAIDELLDDDPVFAERIRDGLIKVLPAADGGLERIRRQFGRPKPRARIAAVEIVADAFPKNLKEIEPLAADPVPAVRYHAMLALVRGGDRARVAGLIALFDDLPYEFALMLEDTLCQLHAGEKVPATLAADTPAGRKQCREAWLAWWTQNGAGVPLTRLTEEPALKGLTLIAEVDGPNQRIWEADRDGKKTWEIRNCGGPVDVWPLRGGNVLIGEYYTSQVSERNRRGDIVWSAKMPGNTTSACRLPNGNTLATTREEVVEFDRKGTRVGSYPKFEGQVHQALRDRRGRTFVLTSGGLIELDSANKIARTIPVPALAGWGGFDFLPNGHFLIACYNQQQGCCEIDGAGKILWEVDKGNGGHTATRVQKLRNGNILVAGGNVNEVIEFDANRRVVWKVATEGRPFAVRRY